MTVLLEMESLLKEKWNSGNGGSIKVCYSGEELAIFCAQIDWDYRNDADDNWICNTASGMGPDLRSAISTMILDASDPHITILKTLEEKQRDREYWDSRIGSTERVGPI